IWRFAVDTPSDPSKIVDSRRLISSTQSDEEPRYSPDGASIGFWSERSGMLQAWISDANGYTARQVTNFVRAEKAWLSWQGMTSLFTYAQIPGSGSQLDRVIVAANFPSVRVPSATSNERVLGISNDGKYLYVTREDAAGNVLQRKSLATNQSEVLLRNIR